MTLPTYPEYRDSGEKWIGNVPSSWAVLPLKAIAKIDMGQSPASESYSQDAIGPPFLQGNADFGREHPQPRYYCLTATKLASKGDLLFSVRAPVGAINVADREYGIGRGLCAMRGIHSRSAYLRYAMEVARVGLISVATGSTYASVSVEQVASAKIAFPKAQEQKAIVQFLGSETAKIDALIAEQEKLLALLAEKRQATISHAVTRGLDPEVPMKDSGIPWLGEVPAHWEVRRLKTLSPAITVGIVVNPSDYVSESGLPFIYGGDITEGMISIDGCRRIDPADSARQPKTQLCAGDLLTVRVGAPGVTAVVPGECEGGNCASVMLTRRGEFDSDWLCFAMNSRMVRHQVEVVQYGAAQEQFNIGHAINFWIATPPRGEQADLARHLKKLVRMVDELASETSRAIDLLRERRSALISAAVTGKIDIRSLINPGEE